LSLAQWHPQALKKHTTRHGLHHDRVGFDDVADVLRCDSGHEAAGGADLQLLADDTLEEPER
jgi:hypothetical protein